MFEEKAQQDETQKSSANPITDRDISGAAGTVYAAGQHTVSIIRFTYLSFMLTAQQTWSTLAVFVLYMVLHPEVQEQAWAEIDSVLGKNRLPTFSDRLQLPYTEYVVQETLR